MTPEEKYIQLLEKVNQQLDIWKNPYGLMVTILTLLVAFLAIVVAYAIFRQGADYNKKLENDRKAYKKEIDRYLSEQSKIIKHNQLIADKLNKKTDKIIKEYKNKLEDSSAKQKKKIEETIARLEVERIKVDKDNFEAISVSPNCSVGLDSLLGKKFCTCSYCKYGFYVNDNTYTSSFAKSVTCPKCGSLNTI